MRLPRMTTRRWMIAVLIVGLLMGGIAARVHLDQEAARRRAIGTRHSLKEYECRKALATLTEQAGFVEVQDARRDLENRKLAYHAQLKMKYWLSALSPWLPVEPDPPEPE